MREQVQVAIDSIRPALQADGGDIELIEVTKTGIVRVQLTGACHGCPMAVMTLKQTVERTIKEEVPEVTQVESV